jgi:threonine aldolase
VADDAESTGDVTADVYGKGSALQDFEEEVAHHLLSPARNRAAVFMPSGGMAQSISIMLHHEQRRFAGESPAATASRSFFCHATCHLLIHEQDAYKELLGFEAVVIGDPGRSVSAEDVETAIRERKEQGKDMPSVLILECPHREIGGTNTPFEDLVRIRELSTIHGFKLHMVNNS